MDRNIVDADFAILCAKSLSARRAWIEIFATGLSTKSISVALRKESVDRNLQGLYNPLFAVVALRKESVDRNDAMQVIIIIVYTSLSARRAWIEIGETT